MAWQPHASAAVAQARARMLAEIRAHFARTGALEVETPALSRAATTDPALHSFVVQAEASGAGYLHTSPEYAMKRLLAAGFIDPFQICKVFRAAEQGRRHNPEFSMLEWYRVGWDYRALMEEVAELVQAQLGDRLPLSAEYLSYAELFEHHLGVDVHRADCARLRAIARSRGLGEVAGLDEDVDAWRDLLLSHLIEPQLGQGRLTFIYDYPATQAALARIELGEVAVAQRFELYVEGVELANGFQELTDAAEQVRRLQADNRERRARGLDEMPIDQAFVAALQAGLPECAGVALGLDRLLMLRLGATHIDEVLLFPYPNA